MLWTRALLLIPAVVAALAHPRPFSFRPAVPPLEGVTIFGGRDVNRYLIETTGGGVAMLDYDNDGWTDLFFANGSRLEDFPSGNEPRPHLYRNVTGSGFADMTLESGLSEQSGWGQGVCIGDYDNNGFEDLFVTYFGRSRLYHNRGGRFVDVTTSAKLTTTLRGWGTGCAFLDYDRDGYLDLFVARYVELDLSQSPQFLSAPCRYKGLTVACGPTGLRGSRNVLYRNRRDGTFEDVSDHSGITKSQGTYSLGVVTLDFDGDGWTDLYVANDSQPSALYLNKRDGTFDDIGVRVNCAYAEDGRAQAGMGVAAGDFDRDGMTDIVKTNFADDTASLYINNGQGLCEDRTFDSGLGLNTRWLGWGVGLVDFDNDGWLDIFITNGHVYPEVDRLSDVSYRQPKTVYRNLGARLVEITDVLGPPVTTPRAGRGSAFGDLNNDGAVDVAVNNINDKPDVWFTSAPAGNAWVVLRLAGTRSNRSAIGARARLRAGGVSYVSEVRGGGSYLSQNDLRLHVGLAETDRIDELDITWPNGLKERWRGLVPRRIVTVVEGTGSRIE